jgi:hypothetical protein
MREKGEKDEEKTRSGSKGDEKLKEVSFGEVIADSTVRVGGVNSA